MAFALLKTFLVLVVGIFSGYLCQKLVDKNHWITPKSKKEISIFLQKLGMLWFVSITYIGSLWIFKIEIITKIISMPFVGAVSTITGGFFAVIIAKSYHYNRIDIGSMFTCGYFANSVTLGGMVCFFYLSGEGYALVPIFTFLIRLLYYGLGYSIVHMYAEDFVEQKETIKKI